MISDERLEEIAYGDDWYPPEVKEAMIELLAHRKAWREPVGYVSQIYMDDWAAGGTIHKKRLVNGIPLYRTPFSD